MADILAERTSDRGLLQVLTAPREGSLKATPDGDIVFEPGRDFADLVRGETRTVNFKYMRTRKSGSNIGTATIFVRAEGRGAVVESIEFKDTQTVSCRIAPETLVPAATARRRRCCTILRHPPAGDLSAGEDGILTFHPGHDFDDLASGELRSVTFDCKLSDNVHARAQVYAVTLTIEGGLCGVFLSDIRARSKEGQPIVRPVRPPRAPAMAHTETSR